MCCKINNNNITSNTEEFENTLHNSYANIVTFVNLIKDKPENINVKMLKKVKISNFLYTMNSLRAPYYLGIVGISRLGIGITFTKGCLVFCEKRRAFVLLTVNRYHLISGYKL